MDNEDEIVVYDNYDEWLKVTFPNKHEVRLVTLVDNNATPEQIFEQLVAEARKYCRGIHGGLNESKI